MYNTVFKCSQELTFDTVAANLAALRVFINQLNTDVFHLDLSALTLCDSAGLALLIAAKRLCGLKKKTLVIESMPHTVEALVEFCGVGTLLRNHDGSERI